MSNDNVVMCKSMKYFYACGIFLSFAACSFLVTSLYMLFTLNVTSVVQYVIIAVMAVIGTVLYILGDSCENHTWWLYELYVNSKDLFEEE